MMPLTLSSRDLLEVAKRYQQVAGNNALTPLLSRLGELARNEDGSIGGLEKLPDAWRATCADARQRAPRTRVNREYFPARAARVPPPSYVGQLRVVASSDGEEDEPLHRARHRSHAQSARGRGRGIQGRVHTRGAGRGSSTSAPAQAAWTRELSRAARPRAGAGCPSRRGRLRRAVIVLDASVVVAYFNASERRHEAVASWLEAVDEDLVTTPLVLAEIDYVLGRRAGADALDAFWADLDDGVYAVRWWPAALGETIAAARHADVAVGLADASLVALAAHLGTHRIATLDEAHFSRLRPGTGESSFVLLPPREAPPGDRS